jgi:hypothetical protein
MFAGVKYFVLHFCFIQIVANITGSIKIGLGKIFGPKRKEGTRDRKLPNVGLQNKCPYKHITG